MYFFICAVRTANHYQSQKGKKNNEAPVFQRIIAHQKFSFYYVVKPVFHFQFKKVSTALDRTFSYIFSATRSFALRARLFCLISSFEGIMNFPTALKGTSTLPKTSFSGSPSNIPFFINRFTNLSSKE